MINHVTRFGTVGGGGGGRKRYSCPWSAVNVAVG